MSQPTLNSIGIGTLDFSRANSSEDVYEIFAEFMVNALQNARETLNNYVKGLEGAEKAKYEKISKQVDDYLEQLAKSKKLSGLQKFFKALGGLGMLLAVITAVLVPTPMTIALLVVTTAMFMESLISEAAGSESLIEKGMGELFKAMSDALGPVGAAVMASLIMVTVAAALTAALGAGMSMLASSTNSMVQSVRSFIQEIPKAIMRFFKSELTPEQSQTLRRFLEVTQSAVLIAQSGVQFDMATISFELAKLVREYDIDQALIDGWMNTIRILSSDTTDQQQYVAYLEQTIPGLFDKHSR